MSRRGSKTAAAATNGAALVGNGELTAYLRVKLASLGITVAEVDGGCWVPRGARHRHPSGWSRIGVGGKTRSVAALIFAIVHGVEPIAPVWRVCPTAGCCRAEHLTAVRRPRATTDDLSRPARHRLRHLHRAGLDGCTLARRFGLTVAVVQHVLAGAR